MDTNKKIIKQVKCEKILIPCGIERTCVAFDSRRSGPLCCVSEETGGAEGGAEVEAYRPRMCGAKGEGGENML